MQKQIRAQVNQNMATSIYDAVAGGEDSQTKIGYFMAHLAAQADDVRSCNITSDLYCCLKVFSDQLLKKQSDQDARFLGCFAAQALDQAYHMPAIAVVTTCYRQMLSPEKEFSGRLVNFTLAAREMQEKNRLSDPQRNLLVGAAIAAYQDILKPPQQKQRPQPLWRDHRGDYGDAVLLVTNETYGLRPLN